MFRLVVICVIICLSACGRAPDAVNVETVVPVESVPDLKRHNVFIATSRTASSDTAQFFTGERSQGLNFASVEVTVPPNHVPGKVERTKAPNPDPRRHFVITDPQTYSGSSDFERDLLEALNERPPGSRSVLVFIHGYNTTMTDAILQLAQFVEDSGYDGIPLLFSWASGGAVAKYVYDLNSALVARDGLVSLLGFMQNSAVESYDVMAHSMGTLLTMEAGRQIAMTRGINPTGRTRNVILAAPDIDFDLFVSQVRAIPEEYRSFVVLVSQDDKALKASRRVAGGVVRAGAAPIEVLASLGVTAIDLTEIEDESSLSHSKFRDSPAVVQQLGATMRDKSTFSSEGSRSGIVRAGVDGVLGVVRPGG